MLKPNENKIIEECIDLVLSSVRRMPAHFCHSETSNQSFLVDYPEIDPEDEYEMAAQAWHKQPDMETEDTQIYCLKTGEDIMLGSYIIAQKGYPELSEAFMEEMIRTNLSLLQDELRKSMKEAFHKENASAYFEMCCGFGRGRIHQ